MSALESWRRRGLAPAAAFVVAALAAVAVPLYARHLIDTTPLPALDVPVSVAVVDRDGALLRPFQVADGRWRLAVDRDEVDPLFFAMLLAYEDQRFHAHRGVDLQALARAGWQLARHGRIVSGASTLTMQVARLLAARETRSATGKLAQMRLALALERRLDKPAILDLYLKIAPYGGNLEGVRAASLAWLGREPKRLSAGEAALLVALPQAPEARRPDRSPAAARAARARVLDRALATGIIDAATADRARAEPIPDRRLPLPMLAPHAAERLARAHPGTPVLPTTLDARLQAALERLARERAGQFGEAVSVAILAVDHLTGETLASVGSSDLTDEARGGYLDMTQALRSPGSTLKPLIYALAFERGIAHPESLIEDRPVTFAGYRPENFDGVFHGTVTVRRALQLSLNLPAVQLLDAVGPALLLQRLRRAGATPVLPEASPATLAIGLGGLGMTLEDVVKVEAAIARGGLGLPLLLDRLAPPAAGPDARMRVVDAGAAWLVASVLSGAADPHATSPGLLSLKTGTSYGYRDAWAIGFDGRHTIGVWVGRPDNAPVSRLVGIEAAAPILVDAFQRLPRLTPLPPPPAGVSLATTTALPATLRRARVEHGAVGGDPLALKLAYPPDGARVDLGLSSGDAEPLALKALNGRAPYSWFVDGAPIAAASFERSLRWTPAGPGFFRIAVVDAAGASSRVSVFVE